MALIEEKPKPTDARELVAAELGSDLELRADGCVRKRGVKTAVAVAEDVPQRYDLPKDHPLYGQRVLSVGMSGWPDMTIGADGRPTPIDPKTGEPKPVDVEPDEQDREAIDVSR